MRQYSLGWVEYGLTSHSTHYRSFRDCGKQNNSCWYGGYKEYDTGFSHCVSRFPHSVTQQLVGTLCEWFCMDVYMC